MYLYVSLDDLQLFAGKEGEEEARKLYPILQHWVASREARLALWHAGQVLRAAKTFPRNHLKDFYAIAVHHASLALWTYGVVTKAAQRNTAHEKPSIASRPEYVLLDGVDSLETQRFVAALKGIPAIRGFSRSPGPEEFSASMEDPKACMEVTQGILRANFEDQSLPPIVENLCQMMKQLGHTAWAVGLG
jgi:hypothetical protein